MATRLLRSTEARTGGADGREAASRSKRRLVTVTAGCLVAFAIFALPHFFPAKPYGIAADYRVLASAGRVVSGGGDPYDNVPLTRAEQELQRYPKVEAVLDAYANPPIVAWMMQPVAALPFWLGFSLIVAVAATGLVAGSALVLRMCGWRRPWLTAAGIGISWISLLGLIDGQFDGMLLGGLALSLWLSVRGRTGIAGLLAVLCWIKPHVLWPLPVLVAGGLAGERAALSRYLAGVAAAFGAGLAIQLVAEPGLLPAFIRHTTAWESRIGGEQPDLASAAEFLRAYSANRLVGVALIVAGASAVVAVAVWTATGSRALLPRRERLLWSTALGLGAWLLLTPYSHSNDTVVLLPLFGLALGPDGARIGGRDAGFAGAVCGLVVAAAVLPLALAAAAVGLLALLALRAARGWDWAAAASALASTSFVALVILPAMTPLHIARAGLTPIAIGLLVAAAVTGLRAWPPPDTSSLGRQAGNRPAGARAVAGQLRPSGPLSHSARRSTAHEAANLPSVHGTRRSM